MDRARQIILCSESKSLKVSYNKVDVGEDVVLNTRASVDHETVIAIQSVIYLGTIISSAVKLGLGTFVGAGAIVRHLIKQTTPL